MTNDNTKGEQNDHGIKIERTANSEAKSDLQGPRFRGCLWLRLDRRVGLLLHPCRHILARRLGFLQRHRLARYAGLRMVEISSHVICFYTKSDSILSLSVNAFICSS